MTKEKNQRILHLVLKRKWWDMIESGEKPDEYRDFTDYWIKRLCDNPTFDKDGKIIGRKQIDDYTLKMCKHKGLDMAQMFRNGNMIPKEYDAVCFHRGYTNVTMLYEFKGTSIGYGNPAWGAPTDKEVFIIKLGKRI